MPITDVFILCVIVLAFFAFAVALAWGDSQTREIARASRARALSSVRVDALKRTAGAAEAGDKAAEKAKEAPAHA
jgi:hypothetical protein